MKKVKYLIAFVFALAIVGSLPFADSALSAKAEQSSEWDYTQDFTDAALVNADFEAYYLSKFMGSLAKETVVSASDGASHWVASGGVLARENNLGVQYNADSIAMLSFKKQKFANFKMQVDLRQGDATTFWTGFAIRQDAVGKHFFEDGQVFYTEWDGSLKTWGQGLHGGPFLCGKLNAYDRTAWYTYTVTVEGNRMTIEAVRTGTEEAPSTMTVRLPWKFYKAGYITLMSINNNSMYRNLKLKALPNSEGAGDDFDLDQQTPAAGGEDSLDHMAGTEKDGPVADVPPIANGADEKPAGCGAAAGLNCLFLALGLGAAAGLTVGIRALVKRGKAAR